MIPDILLSICLVTYNREKQLKAAIESCFSCELPIGTEFVIVDNGSTDNTEEMIRALFADSTFSYKYKKMSENVGAGAGRNEYCQLASGKYIYGMDDDAEIDHTNNPDFFLKGIQILENHEEIVALATQIYDEAWERNRQEISGDQLYPSIYRCKMFSGGSHFLRHSFYKEPPYYPNKYGYEELPPSLLAYNSGYITAFTPDIRVIHKPKINKWKKGESGNEQYIMCECASQYAVKRRMYPYVTIPLCYLAYVMRIRRHCNAIENAKEKCDLIVRDNTIDNCNIRRVKIGTILLLYKYFGFSIF
jgi:glycosyltransferase involved in cell wall biosynthesis